MRANDIKIVKKRSLKSYLPEIDIEEASSELVDEMKENSKEMFAITLGKRVIGVAYIYDRDKAYITINIFKSYRNKGYGTVALMEIEKMIKNNKITAIYGYHNEVVKKFILKNGYKPTWASTLMKYRGEKFEVPNISVRQYRDEDYNEAFILAEEAFHRMRVGTGCFPDSQVGKPSEESRKRWLKDASDKFVMELNGEIVGYASLDDEELESVSIKISHQGKGLGTIFVKYMTNLLIDRGVKEPILWCVVGNNNARHIYDSLNYKEVFCEGFAEKDMNLM